VASAEGQKQAEEIVKRAQIAADKQKASLSPNHPRHLALPSSMPRPAGGFR
ncbi:MAG: hypothetical protein SGPRY_009309, partial [Prymnesium sp.]